MSIEKGINCHISRTQFFIEKCVTYVNIPSNLGVDDFSGEEVKIAHYDVVIQK